MRFPRRTLFASIIAAVFVAACGPSSAPTPTESATPTAPPEPARVAAAASLTDALNEIGRLYVAAGHPKPEFNFASSAILARQIEQGSPTDLFVSADEPWMDYVAEKQLIDPTTRASFLSNKLVLIAPTDRPLDVSVAKDMKLKAALKGGKLAMGDPDSVPAGKYGKAALESLGVWASVETSVARADNVRAALLLVERGEANAGIVYATDQMSAGDKVKLVGEFPADSHPPITYPLAVVKGGRDAEARAFAAFLQGPEASAVFGRLGFTVLVK